MPDNQRVASSADNASRLKPRVRRTALERLELARRIDEAWVKGVPWDEIATELGIPKRTAQDIHRKFVIQVEALKDPQQALTETVFLSTAAIAVLRDGER